VAKLGVHSKDIGGRMAKGIISTSPLNIETLIKLLSVHYNFPLAYPLAGAYFEEMFAYASSGKRSDKKLLFDCVKGTTGWSLKTIIWPKFEIDDSFEVVLQRCDILRDRGLSMQSTEAKLGAAIEERWTGFVKQSMVDQGITDARNAFLVRDRRERRFALIDVPNRATELIGLRWMWANPEKRSLLGYKGDKLIYRWYRSGTQLFGVYPVPRDAVHFDLDWTRADLDEVIAYFLSKGLTKVVR